MIAFYLYPSIIGNCDVKKVMYIAKQLKRAQGCAGSRGITRGTDPVPLSQQRAIQVRYAMRIHCPVFLSPGVGTATCGFVC